MRLTATSIPQLLLPLCLLLTACPGTTGDTGDDCDPPPRGTGPTLAANGWPESVAPGDFAGTGYQRGDVAIDFTASDQFGHTDVSLSQFYGSMVLLDFSALWCVPCNQAAATAQDLHEAVNASTDAYHFWYIHLLIDDNDFGVTETEGWATVDQAATWADDYGIEFPVLAGRAGWDQSLLWGAQALPMLFLMDPELQIREILTGYGGDAAMQGAVRAAWNSFCEENPDWESPY